MTLRISIPFGYRLADTTLEYDFTELRKDTRHIYQSLEGNEDTGYVKDRETLSETRYTEKYYRVLEQHIDLKHNILDIFHLFAKNTYGDYRFKITTSWLPLIKEGESIQVHRHANCFYSGLLYYGEEYGEESARLRLVNPLANELPNTLNTGRDDNIEMNGLVCTTEQNVYLRPFTGGLYFFPANIWHNSGPHIGPPRYSLAFNIAVDDVLLNADSSYDPKWL